MHSVVRMSNFHLNAASNLLDLIHVLFFFTILYNVSKSSTATENDAILSHGITVFLVESLCFSWNHCVSRGITVLLVESLCFSWNHCASRAITVLLVESLCFSWNVFLLLLLFCLFLGVVHCFISLILPGGHCEDHEDAEKND